MNKGDLAKEYFDKGYNCTQSVILAFSDEIGIDTKTLIKVGSSFGGGMGRLREVCGAFSGMCIVLGYLHGFDGENGISKAEHYALIREMAEKFKEENGSYICRELLGDTVNLSNENPSVRSEEYRKKRPCGEICKIGAEILYETLKGLEK